MKPQSSSNARHIFGMLQTYVNSSTTCFREGLLYAALLGLTLLLTILPYLVYNPPLPFSRDMHHFLNVEHIIAQGKPFPAPPHIQEYYPNTFGYLMASFGLLTGLDIVDAFKVVPVAAMLGSALAIYTLTMRLFGRYVATLSLLVYGVLSYQPRQTFVDGAFIEVLAAFSLLPILLYGLCALVTCTSYRFVVLTGLLGAAIIQYHFLTTLQLIVVVSLFAVGVLALRRDLLSRGLAKRFCMALLLALVLALPYTFRYALVYVSIILGRLGIWPSSQYEARFPPINFPLTYESRLGHMFFWLGMFCLAIFALRYLLTRKVKTSVIVITAWVTFLFWNAQIMPSERSLRLLSLPFSIVIALTLYELRHRRILSIALLLLLTCLALPVVVEKNLAVGKTTIYADAVDLASLRTLGNLISTNDEADVLTDESGIWVPYFAKGRAFVFPGGPEGFEWYGEPERKTFEELYEAWQHPCNADSLEMLLKHHVTHIYLGKRPDHWTLPGYKYNKGKKFLKCPNYEPVYEEDTERGPIRIFAVYPPCKVDSITKETYYRLGNEAALVGYDLSETASRGCLLPVTLHWQALSGVNQDYTVFVHLLDQEGRLVSQHDGYPTRNTHPTSQWSQGEIVDDVHQLPIPLDLPPGRYRIAVGMYPLETMERLPAFDDQERRLPHDTIVLGKILLEG